MVIKSKNKMPWVCEYCNNNNSDELSNCFICGVSRFGVDYSIQQNRLQLCFILREIGIHRFLALMKELGVIRLDRVLNQVRRLKEE